MKTKRAWCYFCNKRVRYVRVEAFKTYYHFCPKVGYEVKMGIGNTRIKAKRGATGEGVV